MASQSSADVAALKSWERGGGPSPFKPPSAGNTSDVVEASGTANPGEIVRSTGSKATLNRNALGRPTPPRPWEPNYSNYRSYNSALKFKSGYGSRMYGSYGGYGGLYGNRMNRGGYGGYRGQIGDLYGAQGSNDPYGAPPSPPGFWMSVLRVMHGVVDVFGRISFLIDENTQAFHMFMTSLLQILDCSGLLYSELARFVLRFLEIKANSQNIQSPVPNELPLPGSSGAPANQHYIEGSKAAPSSSWDKVWENDTR